MNEKTRKIVGWVISGLLGALLLFSAFGKLSGNMTEDMTSWGFTEGHVVAIGIVEVICLVLFLIPKTSSLGTLLLASYMGGAIATHMQQGDSFIFQAVVNGVVYVAGFIRNPGLLSSFTNNS